MTKEKKEASKLLCSRRVLSRISRTKEFKSGEGYGCFYDRLSIRPSPDSHSLLRCILVWRSTRISLSHPTISKPATRSQLMARVPRSPSMANIRSAQSFPRFSSQFFFFSFFDVRIFRRTGLENVLRERVELQLCESIEGKTQQVIVSSIFFLVWSHARLYNFIDFLNST